MLRSPLSNPHHRVLSRRALNRPLRRGPRWSLLGLLIAAGSLALLPSCGQGTSSPTDSDPSEGASQNDGQASGVSKSGTGPEALPPQGEGSQGAQGPKRDEYGIPLDAPVSAEARAKIGELMEVFRPIALDLTSDHHDRQIFEQREIYQELLKLGPEVGKAALHAYTGALEEPMLVRRALLWVGGKTAPAEAEELLAHLVETYGRDFSDRTEAALVLAESSPDRYLEIVRPYLERRERLKKWMPDDEFLVQGWVNAHIVKGTSPVPMLADVATNLLIMPNARSLAAKRIGDFPNELIGQRALETCLIESSGDHYLRRMAAQSIVKLLPRETACAVFEETLAREVDHGMAKFLRDMVNKNCR